MGKYTPEDIEAFKKADPATLTGEQRRLANLVPFVAGTERAREIGKYNRRGVVVWSKHFKRLMGDEELLKSIISSTPSSWKNIVEDIPADVIAAGLITIVTRAVAKAVADGKPLDKTTLQALEVLNKIAYGEKKDISLEDSTGFFDSSKIIFNVVEPRERSAKPTEES